MPIKKLLSLQPFDWSWAENKRSGRVGVGERLKNVVGIEGKTWEFLKPMVGYNAANITLGGAGYTLSLYHQQYLTFVEGLPVGIATNIGGISGIVDAFTDVVMGAMTDKTRSRFGRHRRYLLWGALPFAISFIMRWTSFGLSSSAGTHAIFLYYLCASLLYGASYTVMAIPHNAMLPQVAPQYFLRTQFKIVEYAFNSIGQTSSFLLMGLVLGGTNMPDPSPADRGKYMWVGIVLAVWFLWPPIATFFGTKAPSSLDMPRERAYILAAFAEYARVFKSRAFRQYFFMGLFNMLSRSFYSFTDQFFILSVADKYKYFNLLNVVGGVAEFSGSPVNYMLTKHKGKQFCGDLLTPVMVAGLLLNWFVKPTSPSIILYIAAILYNFGFSGPGFTIQNIQPDITDIDELICGKRREGVISTANSFFKKTIGSGTSFVLGNMLQHVFRYDTSKKHYTEQTALSTLGLRLNFTIFPAICALIMYFLIKRYKLTKADHELIRTLIAQKHETGHPPAVSPDDILRLENITGVKWHDMWISWPQWQEQEQCTTLDS
ncbi:MAG: MFS transporter [Oscillospiraceae bacterium]|nr:MFS transporter [Oscillospiraceae bacterium]